MLEKPKAQQNTCFLFYLIQPSQSALLKIFLLEFFKSFTSVNTYSRSHLLLKAPFHFKVSKLHLSEKTSLLICCILEKDLKVVENNKNFASNILTPHQFI